MRALMLAALMLPWAALGQDVEGDALGGYTNMEVDAGRMKGNFGGQIDQLTNGVAITLTSEDPDLAPLPIRASSMDFSYAEGATSPSVIRMNGNVLIAHPRAEVTANAAVWNMDTGEVVFTGNPAVNRGKPNQMLGSEIRINFKTEDFEITDARVDEYDPRQGDASAPAGLLTDGDITDWPGLINTIKAQDEADTPSPGKRIVALIEPSLRGPLRNTPTDDLLELKDALLKQLNKVIRSPEFYDAEAFAGIALSENVQTMLDSGEDGNTILVNRRLLEAAYPNATRKLP